MSDASGGSGRSLLQAAKWLLADLLSTLLFVGLYVVTGRIAIAAGLAIAMGIGQILFLKLRGLGVDAMQWLSLVLVVGFGTAALFTQNPTFIMLKPSLIYVAVGAVMLKPGWMNRYAPPIARERAGDVMVWFGYLWSALMFATAALNLVVAFLASSGAWLWFIGVFPIASKVLVFLLQFIVLRSIIRRRLRRLEPSQPAVA